MSSAASPQRVSGMSLAALVQQREALTARKLDSITAANESSSARMSALEQQVADLQRALVEREEEERQRTLAMEGCLAARKELDDATASAREAALAEAQAELQRRVEEQQGAIEALRDSLAPALTVASAVTPQTTRLWAREEAEAVYRERAPQDERTSDWMRGAVAECLSRATNAEEQASAVMPLQYAAETQLAALDHRCAELARKCADIECRVTAAVSDMHVTLAEQSTRLRGDLDRRLATVEACLRAKEPEDKGRSPGMLTQGLATEVVDALEQRVSAAERALDARATTEVVYALDQRVSASERALAEERSKALVVSEDRSKKAERLQKDLVELQGAVREVQKKDEEFSAARSAFSARDELVDAQQEWLRGLETRLSGAEESLDSLGHQQKLDRDERGRAFQELRAGLSGELAGVATELTAVQQRQHTLDDALRECAREQDLAECQGDLQRLVQSIDRLEREHEEQASKPSQAADAGALSVEIEKLRLDLGALERRVGVDEGRLTDLGEDLRRHADEVSSKRIESQQRLEAVELHAEERARETGDRMEGIERGVEELSIRTDTAEQKREELSSVVDALHEATGRLAEATEATAKAAAAGEPPPPAVPQSRRSSAATSGTKTPFRDMTAERSSGERLETVERRVESLERRAEVAERHLDALIDSRGSLEPNQMSRALSPPRRVDEGQRPRGEDTPLQRLAAQGWDDSGGRSAGPSPLSIPPRGHTPSPSVRSASSTPVVGVLQKQAKGLASQRRAAEGELQKVSEQLAFIQLAFHTLQEREGTLSNVESEAVAADTGMVGMLSRLQSDTTPRAERLKDKLEVLMQDIRRSKHAVVEREQALVAESHRLRQSVRSLRAKEVQLNAEARSASTTPPTFEGV
eukprot:Hpha_TRINITY_DN16277_c2_g2::TRINITY_DN16277_c2_g2_i1::g.12140::m.12140